MTTERIEQARRQIVDAPLEVPALAMSALTHAKRVTFTFDEPDDHDVIVEDLRAIAAPIVAAELKRLAVEAFYAFDEDAATSLSASKVRDAMRRRASRLIDVEEES